MMRVVRPRVHVTAPVLDEVTAALADAFELVDAPEGADGVLSLLTTQVDAAFLDRVGPRLRVVANYAVGVNNVDLAAAAERGVVVANTPDVLTRATAELALGLMLALLRRIAEGDRFVRRGEAWEFSLEFMLGTSLEGKTLLIVGPGRIGRETARLAEAFGARPRFASRTDDLLVLLAEADVVSVHVPLTPATRHLIGAEELRAMRSTAVLVNTARGPIVDEAALVDALRSGELAGAALDVFEREPEVEEGLLSLQNVVLTPHLGSATRDTRIAMGMLCVEALRAVLLDGRRPANAVDLDG
jgi:glyoxylate reductase